jgi:hypothetical protein
VAQGVGPEFKPVLQKRKPLWSFPVNTFPNVRIIWECDRSAYKYENVPRNWK